MGLPRKSANCGPAQNNVTEPHTAVLLSDPPLRRDKIRVPGRGGWGGRRFGLICAKPRKRIDFRASERKIFWHFEPAKPHFFAQPARRLSAIQSDFCVLEAKTRRFLMARARTIFRAKPRKMELTVGLDGRCYAFFDI